MVSFIQKGQIRFNEFAFFDFTTYAIKVDQPWVAVLASYPLFHFGEKSSNF